MTSTARQLRQPPAIEAIERVLYFPDVLASKLAKLVPFSVYLLPYNIVLESLNTSL